MGMGAILWGVMGLILLAWVESSSLWWNFWWVLSPLAVEDPVFLRLSLQAFLGSWLFMAPRQYARA
jgi:hypothetical protein